MAGLGSRGWVASRTGGLGASRLGAGPLAREDSSHGRADQHQHERGSAGDRYHAAGPSQAPGPAEGTGACVAVVEARTTHYPFPFNMSRRMAAQRW